MYFEIHVRSENPEALTCVVAEEEDNYYEYCDRERLNLYEDMVGLLLRNYPAMREYEKNPSNTLESKIFDFFSEKRKFMIRMKSHLVNEGEFRILKDTIDEQVDKDNKRR